MLEKQKSARERMLPDERDAKRGRRGAKGYEGMARGQRGVDSVAECRSLIVARVYPWLEDSATAHPCFGGYAPLRQPPSGYPSGIYSTVFLLLFLLSSDSRRETRATAPF